MLSVVEAYYNHAFPRFLGIAEGFVKTKSRYIFDEQAL